jgi:hypothetical protein
MVVAFMASLSTVRLCQLQAITFHSIDGADVDSVRPDDFHMLSDVAQTRHVDLL